MLQAKYTDCIECLESGNKNELLVTVLCLKFSYFSRHPNMLSSWNSSLHSHKHLHYVLDLFELNNTYTIISRVEWSGPMESCTFSQRCVSVDDYLSPPISGIDPTICPITQQPIRKVMNCDIYWCITHSSDLNKILSILASICFKKGAMF